MSRAPVCAVAIEPSPSGSWWVRLSDGERIGPYLTRAEVDAGAKRLGYVAPRLVILPGGLLGRVTGHDADGLPIVDRWHHGAAVTGWRSFGVEARPLPAASPEGHPSYAAALARIGEVAT